VQVTPATLDAIYYAFNLQYQTGYTSANTWHEKLCSIMPSSTRSERYAWMKTLPAFREWLGERIFNSVVAREYEIINKDWEDSVELDRNDIMDDRIGVFRDYLQMMGQQAKRWPDDVMAPIIQKGNASLCFDGQFFFDVDHPVDLDNTALGPYSNYFTGTPLSLQNASVVRAAMASYLNESGKPMMVDPRLLIVPPQLREVAAQICNATFVAPASAFGQNAAGGFQENVLKGSFDFLEVPQFANEPTVWYIADMSRPIKPLVWQLRKAPEFVSVTDPASEPVFNRKKFQYGADSRGNGGYSLPFLMSRCEA
jgi:phage major head subunit gpT-like protein